MKYLKNVVIFIFIFGFIMLYQFVFDEVLFHKQTDLMMEEVKMYAVNDLNKERILGSVFSQGWYFEEELSLEVQSALLVNEEEGRSIYQSNIDKKIYPASLTKIMTALVAMEYGDLESIITVTDNIKIKESGSKSSGIYPGDQFTLEELLYGLLINSGNDCALAIAEGISGSVEDFVKLMNEKAYLLGAEHTRFTNPHGLFHKNHYSTAKDMYLIFHEALNYDTFKKIISTSSYQTKYMRMNGVEGEIAWENTNQYLQGSAVLDSGITVFGGKTGFTSKAGASLILLSYVDGTPYISLVAGVEDKSSLYKEMTKLLTEGLNY